MLLASKFPTKTLPILYPTQTEFTSKSQPDLSCIIQIYLNFAYYLGTNPYRYVKSSADGQPCYRTKKWIPQQILCVFFHILSIFRLVSQIHETLIIVGASPHPRHPTPYFDFVLETCAFIYKTVTIKRLWFNSKDYLNVLNGIRNIKSLPVTKTLVVKPSFQKAFHAIFAIKVLIRVICGNSFVIPITTWSPSWWLRRLVELSRQVFCFQSPISSDYAPELESLTVGDISLAILMLLAIFARMVLSEFCDLFILSFTMTLWSATSSFSKYVNNFSEVSNHVKQIHEKSSVPTTFIFVEHSNALGETNWPQIYKSFLATQRLSTLINSAVGTQVTWYLAEQLLYFSVYLNAGFVSQDNFVRFNSIIFFVLTFYILYFSADICRNMGCVKPWLERRDEIQSIPSNEMHFILHKIVMSDIGMRGSNAFSITFPFVAGYLSLIATFFIICVQENHVKQS